MREDITILVEAERARLAAAKTTWEILGVIDESDWPWLFALAERGIGSPEDRLDLREAMP